MARRPFGWPNAFAICVIWLVNGAVLVVLVREFPAGWAVLGIFITSWVAGVISNSIARLGSSDDTRA